MCGGNRPIVKPAVTVNDADVARRQSNQDTLRKRTRGAGADLLLEPLKGSGSLFKAAAVGA